MNIGLSILAVMSESNKVVPTLVHKRAMPHDFLGLTLPPLTSLSLSLSLGNSEAFAFFTGDVGIEYSFDFPLLVSFDFRPQVNLNYRDDVNFDVGISARYQF